MLAQELGLQRGAEEITRQLNRIYGVLIDQVHRYGGSMTNFSGDAITCCPLLRLILVRPCPLEYRHA